MKPPRSISYATVNTTDGTIMELSEALEQAEVPPGATIFSADQAATIRAAAADGFQCRFVGGVLRMMPSALPPKQDLDAIRFSACAMIDSEAEMARRSFLTDGAGQALEYEHTFADAQKLLLATGLNERDTGRSNPAAYPWLVAELQAQAAVGTAMTIEDVARGVLQARQRWVQAGVEIKRLRRIAKLKVAAAQSAGEISAVLSGLVWPKGK